MKNRLERIWWRLTWIWHMGHEEPCHQCGRGWRSYFDVHKDYPELCLRCGREKKEEALWRRGEEEIESLLKHINAVKLEEEN